MSTYPVINDTPPFTQMIAGLNQTVYPTTWTADQATDVNVYVRALGVATNDVTQLVNPTLYTIAFIGAGNIVQVTFNTAPDQYSIVTIIRNTPADRLNLYQNTNFTPSMLNSDIGLLTLVDQQNALYGQQIAPRYNLSETVVTQNPSTGIGGDQILPILQANEFWVKDDLNQSIVAVNITDIVPETTGPFITYTADPGIPDAQNLGLLSSGVLAITVTDGVATLTSDNYDVPSALTIVSDNNIVCTATGSPTVCLLDPTTLTFSWSGTLPVSRGGTGVNSFVAYELVVTGTSTTAPLTNTVSNVANEVLVSNGVGQVPNFSSFLPDGVQTNITMLGTITTGIWNGTILDPAYGGTGFNNTPFTINIGGDLATSGSLQTVGAHPTTFTMTNTTNVIFPTSGTLATTSQLPTAAALTVANDTNVTLTLSGTPSTALLQAAEVTAGWTGELSLARGGSNNSITASAGGIVWSDASKLNVLAGTSTAGQIILSGNAATPTWSTTTYPSTNAINTLLYASAANTMAALATQDNSIVATSNTGVPSLTTTLPIAVQSNITEVGALVGGSINDVPIGQSTPVYGAFSPLVAAGVSTGYNFASLAQSIASGSSTAVLSVNSGKYQIITGSNIAGQAIELPNALTAQPGYEQVIISQYTGAGSITISDGNAGLLVNVPNGAIFRFKLLTNGTTAGTWKITQEVPGAYTIPATISSQGILYGSAANVVTQLTATASGVIDVSAAGNLQCDTTNFNVLSTGLQLRGNNTNAAPSAGQLGEYKRAVASATALTTNTPLGIVSLTLAPGIWNMDAVSTSSFTGASTACYMCISATQSSFSGGDVVGGDNYIYLGQTNASAVVISLTIPNWRILVPSGGVTYYLNMEATFSTGSTTTSTRLSATRVG